MLQRPDSENAKNASAVAAPKSNLGRGEGGSHPSQEMVKEEMSSTLATPPQTPAEVETLSSRHTIADRNLANHIAGLNCRVG